MAPKGESVVFLLDVGPTMHAHLDMAGRAAGDFLTEKMLHHPGDEVSLVLFGTSDTRNRENTKSAAEPGGEGEYAHIVEAHGLAPPDATYLQTVHNLPRGQGRSDFKEALAVAAAVLVEDPAGARAKRRIILVTDLCSRAQEDPDDELAGCLAEGLQQQGIHLDALIIDAPEADEQHQEDKTYNLNQLAAICQELPYRQRHFPSAAALPGAFPAHQVMARANVTGTLDIGSKLKIRIKVAGKTAKEKFPSAGRESTYVEQEAGAAEGLEGLGDDLQAIKRSREYYYVNQEEHGTDVVPENEVASGYRYGHDMVPVEDEMAQFFSYPVEKGMKDVKIVVGDKDSQASCLALAALVEGLARQRQKAVVRFIARPGQKPELFVAAPVRGTATSAPHLLLNSLPFMEDLRDYKFPSFTKKNWAPTEEQLDAAAALVSSMGLGEGEQEQLQPERTPDPALHRLYFECGRRAVDPAAPLQESDPLAQEVLQPHLDRLPGAQQAVEAAVAAFPMDQAAKARRKAGKVGTKTPIEDFERLSAEGDVDGALAGLAQAILDIVFAGMGSSKFQTGIELVDRLRQECCDADSPDTFNTFLEEVAKRCRQDPTKREFWEWLSRREVKKIDSSEAPASQLDPTQAEEWYKQHRRD